MIKDRGNKKWTSLMLVEHKRKLRKLKQSENDKEKPELDQQKLQEMNYLLEKAVNNDYKIKIKYFHNKDYHYYEGKIKSINDKKLVLKNTENIFRLKLNDIININIIQNK